MSRSLTALMWQNTLPNYLSLSRIVLSVFIVECYEHRLFQMAAILFLLAWMTDTLDGMIARRFNQQSEFGEVLDPIADKIFMWSIVILLFSLYAQEKAVVYFFAGCLIPIGIYDTIVLYLRFFSKKEMRANWLAKIKSCVLMASLAVLVFRESIGQFVVNTDIQLFVFGCAGSGMVLSPMLAAFSGLAYFKRPEKVSKSAFA